MSAMGVCGPLRHSACVEIGGRLCGAGSLLPLLCGFEGLNSGHQVCLASTFSPLAYPYFSFSDNFSCSPGWLQVHDDLNS